jgi:putative flippase GtrA
MPKKSHRKLVIQFIEYMVSGGVYFWVGYIAFALFYGVHSDKNGFLNLNVNFDGLGWNLWWSTITSSVIGWTANFIMQRFWVFNNKSLKNHTTQVTGRFMFVTLVDFGLNYLILYGLRQIGISPYIGQFISAGFFTVWNYLWYRYWVFPEKLKPAKKVVTPLRVVAHRAQGHSAYRRAS